MDFNLTVTISVILGLAAIISPILVAVINNNHNYKIRKLELATDKKIEAFESYTRSLTKYLNVPTDTNLKWVKSSFCGAIIYVSVPTFKMMEKINDLLANGELKVIRDDYLSEVCRLLQKDLGVYKRRF